jgi:hypothetical protein
MMDFYINCMEYSDSDSLTSTVNICSYQNVFTETYILFYIHNSKEFSILMNLLTYL